MVGLGQLGDADMVIILAQNKFGRTAEGLFDVEPLRDKNKSVVVAAAFAAISASAFLGSENKV
jgi:hypothetical protein